MAEAAPQAASGIAGDTQWALNALELLWSDEFKVSHGELGYWFAPHSDPRTRSTAASLPPAGDAA